MILYTFRPREWPDYFSIGIGFNGLNRQNSRGDPNVLAPLLTAYLNPGNKSIEDNYYYSSYNSGENFLIMNPGDLYPSDAEAYKSMKSAYESPPEERKSQPASRSSSHNDYNIWNIFRRLKLAVKESSRKVD